jgi:hypothetical protein
MPACVSRICIIVVLCPLLAHQQSLPAADEPAQPSASEPYPLGLTLRVLERDLTSKDYAVVLETMIPTDLEAEWKRVATADNHETFLKQHGGKDQVVADLALNAAWLIPWVLYSAYWDNASRFFTLLIPLVAIIKARWIVSLAARLPRPRATAVVLGLGTAAVTLPALVALVPRPTPYLAAAEFLARTGEARHLSTNSRLGLAYAGPGASLPIPATPTDVRRLQRAGWRWAITDLQVLFGGFDRPEDRFATALWIGRHARSVLTVPYDPAALAQAVLEQDLSFADARA